MLDDIVDVPPADAPKAPRRRRAASRPAGPPAEIVAEPSPKKKRATAPVVEAPPAPVVVVQAPVAMDTGDVPGSTTTSDAAAIASPPRRTRARTPRSAAKPTSTDSTTEPDFSTAPVVSTVPDSAIAQEVVEVSPRARRSRNKAARSPEVTTAAESASADGTTTPSTVTVTETTTTPDVEDAPSRPRRSRNKSSRSSQDTTTSELVAATSRPRRSRSKTSRSTEVAPAIEQPQPAEPVAEVVETVPAALVPDDAVAKALEALEGKRPTRRRRAASRPAGAPAPIDLAAITAALANPEEGESGEVEASEDEIREAEALAIGEAEAKDEADLLEEDAGDEADGEDTPRRRRRRRGGRRRRRGSEDSDADSDQTSETEPEAEADRAVDAEVGEATDGEEPTTASSRRRRRRRRRGEEATAADDDPTEVVVRVREPRARRRPSAPTDEVTGIEGSTRMEAKRQRRREGRAAGRRRAPILSEAEFLARRESVDRVMLVRQTDDLSQIAVLEDGVLVEHYVDRASAASLIGNIYVGKVQNVLPSMEAAFIDIGRGRNAVLYAGEVDWDAFGDEGQSRQVEKVFTSGQSILVQVTKDPVGAKGARLTAHISLPGRYLVYAPGGHLSGISRKLPEQERNRLKEILGDLVAEDASVIIRTAAEGVSEEELVRDITRLKAQWEAIEKKVKQGSAPQLLYGEPDLTVRIVRDLFTEDFNKLVVDGNGSSEDAFDMVSAYVNHVAPHLADRLQQWNHETSGDLFTNNRIDEQIAKALERKVFLPSGGSLIIDRTEAMTVIDVNTGKFTGTGGNLEATVTANNLEAAEEIVRQLRLRDIGGIIVIDFIDMVLPTNRDLLLRRLVECLGRDRTRHQVAEVTSLGLVQMTRKKIGTGLAEAFTEPCETCHGRGYHRHDEPVDTQAPADGGDRKRRR